jgi:sialate O-acetylesterase
MKPRNLLGLTLAVGLLAPFLHADVKVPALFSDHAVLLKSAHVPVWGKADTGEKVTVTLDKNQVSTTAGQDGRWALELNLKDSEQGPFTMTVEGKNKLTFSDVVVGEVWLASGQSNMERLIKETSHAAEVIAQPADPMIREFKVTRNPSKDPVDDVQGHWVIASPETRADFSAVAYYFAKKLQGELKVPVGVINSTWGGTHSESWTSTEAIESVPELKEARDRMSKAVAEYPDKKKNWVAAMLAWMKNNGREDHPATDTEQFAGTNVDTSSWISVTLPGEVKAAGLPSTGAVWLRKEIKITKPLPFIEFWLPIDGYDTVYWNGKKVAQTTVETFNGTGYVRRAGLYQVPPSEVLEGRNVLAIRLFEPVIPAKFTSAPNAGVIPLAGAWLAKSEFELPPPQADKPAPLPPNVVPEPEGLASTLFNGMIHPLLPYAIRGVIWYQGEANAVRANQYRTAFPLLIGDWRKQWHNGDLPFYFCQLANFMPKKPDPSESAWAELRDAQASVLRLPHTGQAVLIDLGEAGDIHPCNKKDPGDRLASIALAKDYGKSVPYSGPVLDSMKIEGDKAILTFKPTEGGLVARQLPADYLVSTVLNKKAPLVRNSPGSQLEGFAVCGADRKWVWADARIEGDSVIVSSSKVPAPVAVRYAWADNPTCNLYNGAGLPASPFRTDDFDPITKNAKY